jgi:cobyrinic acid a,c-diamide synthase
MYLSRSLRWNDEQRQMVGALALDIQMHQRPQGRGYVKLEETNESLWRNFPLADNAANAATAQPVINAHEFHYSAPVESSSPALAKNTQFAYRVLRGHGINGESDGIIHRNVLANYSHMRNVKNNPWVKRFVAFVRSQRNK